jgi:hypothetical protein
MYRSNYKYNVYEHFKFKHGITNRECIQKLDKADAARTLAAYNQEHPHFPRVHNAPSTDSTSRKTPAQHFKPYKCSFCEFRSGRKDSAAMHIKRSHALENVAASYLVTVLPMDVAKQTIDMYNKTRNSRNCVIHSTASQQYQNHRQTDNLDMPKNDSQVRKGTRSVNQHPC